ncbi:MAG: 30S ribosomal protein S1, partial [Gammaproteobacteria bacterium]|nr:30S ribosomal protein S1 [Gammaproteobacteria bacterium]
MTESFAELFEQSLENLTFRTGAIIKADVVAVNSDVVIVNAGLKSESAIPVQQFYDEDGNVEVEVGDQVEVALDALEDGFGSTRLSREKAKRLETWKRLETAQEAGETITGVITGRVKGGFTVEIAQVRAFLPGSLVDSRPVRDVSYLEGKKLEFKVIKIDAKRNNIVVSRRAVIEEESGVDRDELIEKLQEGAVIQGSVKNLTDYGAFIDLGGMDGLLHITDMSWKRINNPSEVLTVGDAIDVKVLRFDREKMRVSLGMKQLADDPWQGIARRYPLNSRIFGKVTNVEDYGCFVEIESGVEGLVHVSEMDWTNKNINPAKVVQSGDEVEVMVLEIDESRRRISLGLKQCQANPWEEFSKEHSKGDRISGTIRSITDFGIFVGLPGGIDGLVHLSDLSWDVPGEEAVRQYNKGDDIEASILLMETDRGRISLGVKQLDSDPFAQYVSSHPKGSIVKGEVSEVDTRSAVVSLTDGISGIIRASEMREDRVDDARAVFKEGDQVEAVIVHLDRKNRTIQ